MGFTAALLISFLFSSQFISYLRYLPPALPELALDLPGPERGAPDLAAHGLGQCFRSGRFRLTLNAIVL